jgi:hypothetical protein
LEKELEKLLAKGAELEAELETAKRAQVEFNVESRMDTSLLVSILSLSSSSAGAESQNSLILANAFSCSYI